MEIQENFNNKDLYEVEKQKSTGTDDLNGNDEPKEEATIFREQASRSNNKQLSREQKNNSSSMQQQHFSANTQAQEYEISISNYRFLKKLLSCMDQDQAQFESTIKQIKFIANLTPQMIENSKKKLEKYENKPITFNKVNKDQSRTLEFPDDKFFSMGHFRKTLEKEKDVSEIEFDEELNTLNIRNRKMPADKFNILINQLQSQLDQLLCVQITFKELLESYPEIFNHPKEQSHFLKSPFLNYVFAECKIEYAHLASPDRMNNSCRLDYSISSASESESEAEQEKRNFTQDSICYLFGFEINQLNKAIELFKKYIRTTYELDFSHKKDIVPERNKDNTETLLLQKKLKFFQNTMKEDLERDFQNCKGLGWIPEGSQRNETGFRYRLSGNNDEIKLLKNQWDETTKNIYGVCKNIKTDDQFLEDLKISKIEAFIANNKSDSKKFLIEIKKKDFIVFFISKNSDPETKQIEKQLDDITQILREKIPPDVKKQLQPKLAEFELSLQSENNKYASITKDTLFGTQTQIANTRNEIQNFIIQNVQKEYRFTYIDRLRKDIFIRYFLEDIKREYDEFEIIPNKREDELLYKIPEFFANDVITKLRDYFEDIQRNIKTISIPCTEHQFQTLQKATLQSIQREYATQIISDIATLNTLGHKIKDVQVKADHYTKCLSFGTSLPQLQVLLMEADIQNIKLDALMLNIKIDANYVDKFSQDIQQLTGCCRYALEDISKVNSGGSKMILEYQDIYESQINSAERERPQNNYQNSNGPRMQQNRTDQGYSSSSSSSKKSNKHEKKFFQFLQTSVLNTRFPVNSISMAILQNNYSNVKRLLSDFLKRHEDKLILGIIIPHLDNLQNLYISALRQILFEKCNAENNQLKAKNIYLFCQKSQFKDISNSLVAKQEGELIFNLNSSKELINATERIYILENGDPLPEDFQLLLESYHQNLQQKEGRFYAFLPNVSEKECRKYKLIIPANEEDDHFLLSESNKYTLSSFIDNLDEDSDVEDLQQAIAKARQSNIEYLYIYENDFKLTCDLVRVSVSKRKIINFRDKSVVRQYKEINVEKSHKKDYVYVIKGYNEKDIETTQNKLNSELFINSNRKLWDLNYVDDSQPRLLELKKDSQDQDHKVIFSHFEKMFQKEYLIIESVSFIQSIPLSNKFQDQVTTLHNKCKYSPLIYKDMFYCTPDLQMLQNIYKCDSIGFDPRIHNNIVDKNPNCILLKNKPNRNEGDSNLQYCLICEVVEGKKMQVDDVPTWKRLPKDEDNQYFDSLVMEKGNNTSIAIFDFHRIYPSYIVAYKSIPVESDTNFTVEEISRKNRNL